MCSNNFKNMCNCNNPIYRQNENFCRNCWEEKTKQQFTKKSEWEFYGEVEEIE